VSITRPGHKKTFSVETAPWGKRNQKIPAGLNFHPDWKDLSPWSGSYAKRVFDCACVLLALPLLAPLMLLVAAAVRLSSPGPVLFRQQRVGRLGSVFTIFKFRTLENVAGEAHDTRAAVIQQRFTPIGSFLRHWKLDELPQLINVLRGEMSLVGPRPKMPQFVLFDQPCRPGVTGKATTVFAREDWLLARIPRDYVDTFVYSVALPAKRQLDADYMARATFFSDLAVLFRSIFRCWDTDTLSQLPGTAEFEGKYGAILSTAVDPLCAMARASRMRHASQRPTAGGVPAF
jgi:lipopolysaccharide/colanic/teichoic acid biosynthesis glycosyltransferase